jgi:hypothetical protein
MLYIIFVNSNQLDPIGFGEYRRLIEDRNEIGYILQFGWRL